MGKGTNSSNTNDIISTYTSEQIKEHNKEDDQWLVIDGNIYDITRFAKKHPGGPRIISHFAAQDATVRLNINIQFLHIFQNVH